MPYLVRFPNAQGLPLPAQADVLQAQRQYGFSDALRDFLLAQNGMDFDGMDEDVAQAAHWPSCPDQDADGCAELRYLFGLNARADYLDLRGNADAHAMFAEVFMPIGVDPGGNPLVEVLCGQHKGWIASLDHELFASSDSVAEMARDFELDCDDTSSAQDKAVALCDPELGLVWWHAPSLDLFLSDCVHWDEQGRGFVVDRQEAAQMN